jgi:hypothetical protein
MHRFIHLSLQPTPAQIVALQQTIETVNTARNEISAVAYFTSTFRLPELSDLCVQDVSTRLGLSLAMTHCCVASVVAAYRQQRHTQQRFRLCMSIPYDHHTLWIDPEAQTLILWTLIGWQRLPFVTDTAFLDGWSLPSLMHLRTTWALLLVVPGLDNA